MAVDPNGRDLIVNFIEQERVRLERVPLSGGPPQPIQVWDKILIQPYPLASGALNKDGKLLVGVAPTDSWYYGLGILNLATGKLTPVPLDSNDDLAMPSWTSDGHILAQGQAMRSHIWRFRPTH
jgi:hypothetical protein